MQQKLTVTLDDTLIHDAKRHARLRGLSLSALVETSLRESLADGAPSFATRWRGHFRPAQRDDQRYQALARKYISGPS